eukprot:scaffold133_cov257-Pinguiococcus_pyrenoidosus.AAC.27
MQCRSILVTRRGTPPSLPRRLFNPRPRASGLPIPWRVLQAGGQSVPTGDQLSRAFAPGLFESVPAQLSPDRGLRGSNPDLKTRTNGARAAASRLATSRAEALSLNSEFADRDEALGPNAATRDGAWASAALGESSEPQGR